MAQRPMSRIVARRSPREVVALLEWDLGGGWIASARVEQARGSVKPILRDLRFRPRTDDVPANGVTATVLRRFPFDTWRNDLDEVMEWVQLPEGGYGSQFTDEWFAASGLDRSHVEGFTRKPGRKGRPDVEYARIAAIAEAVYLDPNQAFRAPNAEIARRLRSLAGVTLTPTQIRDCLRRARERDILSPTLPGKASGHLTEYGRSLLSGDGAVFEDRGTGLGR
jgi:hypothetical protein